MSVNCKCQECTNRYECKYVWLFWIGRRGPMLERMMPQEAGLARANLREAGYQAWYVNRF